MEVNKIEIMNGMMWKFSERFLAQIISFSVSVVLSRILAPEDFGVISIVLVFISLADVFVTSGLSTALVQNKNATDEDFSTNLYCSLLLSFIIYGILFFLAPYIESYYKIESLTVIIRVFSIRIPISSFSSVQHAYVERHMLFKKYFLSTLFGTVLSGFVGILLAYLKYGVWALIAQYFVNTVVDIIVLFFTIEWRPRLVFIKSSAKSMIDFGWKVLISDLSGVFFNQLRSLLVGHYYSSADLAFYNKGKQFPDLLTTNICSALMTVLFPAISNINDNSEKVKQLTKKSIKTMSFIMFPLLFGLIAIAQPLILLLFTEKWTNSIVFVQILCLASIFNLVSSISLQAIKAVGRSDLILKSEIVKKPLYLILLFLGLRYGLIYVAITMAIYNIFENIINSYVLSKIISYSLKEQFLDIINSFASSLLMCVLIYPITTLNVNFFVIIVVQCFVGFFFYCAVSLVTKNEVCIYLTKLLKSKIEINGKL